MDLERFIKAQELYYQIAYKELEEGYKQSHWMWFILNSNDTVTMLNEEFENDQTGEKVEGITIIVDGQFKQVLDKFFGGEEDKLTLDILEEMKEKSE